MPPQPDATRGNGGAVQRPRKVALPAKVSSEKKHSSATSKKCIVGIHGQWYDLTDFVPVHPGGSILWKLNQMDASEMFIAFHTKPGILARGQKYRTGKTYKIEKDPLKEAYAKMSREFIKKGYMSNAKNYGWWVFNVFRLYAFLALSLWLAAKEWYVMGGVSLTMFWAQCGGFMHDCGHTNVTYNKTIDGWIGWWFSTVMFGCNSEWWQREHFIHHAFTNGYTTAPETQSGEAYNYDMPKKGKNTKSNEVTYAVDYQMREEVWAQSKELLSTFPQTPASAFLLKLQHYYFVPVLAIIGRIGMLILSWKKGGSPRELVGIAIHFYLTYLVLAWMPDWWGRFKFYYTASILEGILHFELVLNHYLNDWNLDENIAKDFIRWVYVSTHNVASPAWLDWLHLGLNIHVEHHLFPKASRIHFRKIMPKVQALGEQYELPYRTVWPLNLYAVTKRLETVAHQVP